MAKQINQLTEKLAADVATPGSLWVGTDYMYGTPGSFKVAIPELKKIVSAYAGIYVVDGAVAQSLTINVWAKLTAFTTDGPALNCTSAAATDKITVTKTGVYRVSFAGSFTSANSSNISVRVYSGSPVAATYIKSQSYTFASPYTLSLSASGFLSLTAGDDVELWGMTDDTGTPAITPKQLQLNISIVN